MGKLFEELKRRKVVRVAGVYAVVAWLLIQVTNNIVPALQMPPWTSTFIVVFLLIGFPIALVLAWAYELAPDGTHADNADQFSPAAAIPSSDRKLIYATFALVLLVAVFQIADRFLAPAQRSSADLRALENNGAVLDAAALPETRVDIVTPASALPADFALSPDGHQIVFVASDDSGTSQLWLRPLATTTAQPLARTEGALAPFWSPDSRSVGFFIGSDLKRLDIGGGAPQTLARTGGPVGVTWGTDNMLLFAPNPLSPLVHMPAAGGELTAMTTGAGEETMVLSTDQVKTPSSWSADGRFLIYHSIGPETARDLWALPMTADPVPFIVLQPPFQERSGVLSPDGRWIAYESDESGRYEVYIRTFLTPNARATGTAAVSGQWQISTDGGSDPVWSPDGQELYYLDPAANMLATPLLVTGDRVEAGAPAVLFPTRIVGQGEGNNNGRDYDVAADGRFLINTLVDGGATAPITLIQNWNPEALQ